MINSNPETVSTDYDTSDLLFFEPLTHEDILNICERLNGEPFTRGCAAPRARQGRDRAVRRADPAEPRARACRKPASRSSARPSIRIDAAGDREQFRELLQKLEPEAARQRHRPQRRRGARRSPSEIGYPVLVRPSFVLGGRAMEIVSDEDQLNYYMTNAVEASTIADAPILDRQVPRRRDRGATSTASPTSTPTGIDARRGDHHRRDGAHRGSRHSLRRLARARCRRTRCRRRSSRG